MEARDRITIFVIDDDKMLTMALKNDIEKTFAQYNAVVSTFEAGEQTSMFIKNGPDIAIVDYHLNSKNKDAMDGVRIIDMIKKESPDTEVIMFTSEEHAEIAVKALHHGAHDYVVKNDFMFRKLNMSVMQCIKLKQLKADIRSQKIKTSVLAVSLVLMAGALIALQIWAPNVLSK
ncbi:MAG: response regulator [Bacteroidota bacterium]